MKAIEQAKNDMQNEQPMDRLICGDVGFGKTEVAIRVAFKAVMAGKQVAVLVPTTVLAQQHFNTFTERMMEYPVRVELLSRFRTKSQQAKTVDALKAGAVDIVIGTHRLVQPDVVFKDLGLVVIDEEQRFGVAHKERFKIAARMWTCLRSVRHLSLGHYTLLYRSARYEHNRNSTGRPFTVETIVADYNEDLISKAIRRELHRGGQGVFLHNRVGTIHTVEKKLRGIVPEARIVVGHGQMKSDELKRL